MKRSKEEIMPEEGSGSLVSKIDEVINRYIGETEWDVRENANTTRSYSDFIGYTFNTLLSDYSILSKYFPIDAVKMHFNGDIHIHKLPHSLWIPYCVGWNYNKILKLGLKTPTIYSSPAKHLSTAVSHLINFFYMASQEWTGAQATSALDLHMAPFVRYDKLDYTTVKQYIQGMFFELNYPSRLGYQAVFTNVTVVLDTVKTYLESDAVVGGKVVGLLGDFIDEALLVTRSLFELLLEGDAIGQPFTFPITTMTITEKFDWNERRWGDLTEIIMRSIANRGAPYILNGYTIDVDSLYAMCCRLTVDIGKITRAEIKTMRGELEEHLRKIRSSRGVWALPDATGSIGVVTINLPRIAIMSKGEWSTFTELLDERLEIARKVLLKMRERYEKSLDLELMPITEVYLGHLRNHYNTIGLVGLPEAVANLLRDIDMWNGEDMKVIEEGVKLSKNIVSHVAARTMEFEEEDGYMYNVEETPAESAAYRLAMKDFNRFRDLVKEKKVFIPFEEGKPFYSNSIIPYYTNIPIMLRAKLEGSVQKEFTGGVMMHLFLYELPEIEALKKLIYRIVTLTDISYFSITPAISICRECKYSIVGIQDKCPKCGGKMDIWSRIVGYYRPLRNWHEGRRSEFRTRIHYGGRGATRAGELI